MTTQRKTVQIPPDKPRVQQVTNLAIQAFSIRQYERALYLTQQAVNLCPDDPRIQCLLGNVFLKLNRLSESLNAYNKALSMDTHNPILHWVRGTVLLLSGDLQAGFRELEWRFQAAPYIHLPKRESQIWDGSPFPGKTLLLTNDDIGFGDIIQMCRYLPKVQALGGTVLFDDKTGIRELLSDYPGLDGFASSQESHFDFHISLMSLPSIFKTGIETIPSPIPFKVPLDSIELMRARVKPSGLRVGLVWAGNNDHPDDAERSIDPRLFEVFNMPGVDLYGLQRPKDLPCNFSMPTGLDANLGEYFRHFGDMAAAIELMDVVVSIDSAPLHLSATMGKPTWGLLAYTPDWRWMLDRTDSPWYPGLRLFRQSQPDQWEPALKRVAEALRILSKEKVKNQSLPLSH